MCSVGDIDAALDMASDELSKETQAELIHEAAATLRSLTSEVEDWKLQALLSGPYDKGDCRLVVTAGAGGTDAQDWAAMLVRMVKGVIST